MANLDYDFFHRQLVSGTSIDETCFYFTDDVNEEEHYVGYIDYLRELKLPYWVGYCDVENGCSFLTADELVNAKIFNGKSLKERWDTVEIVSVVGICFEDWLRYFKHAD